MKGAIGIKPAKKTIFVCVTQGLAGNMKPDIDPATTPPIDCARGCWKVKPSEANKCDWLMAVNQGTIVGVYEIDKSFGWKPTTAGCIPTRQILEDDPTRYYCKLRDISAGHPCMNKHVRMYRSTQYSN